MSAAYVIDGGYVYLTEQDEPRCNAFGQYVVSGALFDTVAGTVQAPAVATCNMSTSVADVIAGVARTFGSSLLEVVPMA
jgi:hypothetical protein